MVAYTFHNMADCRVLIIEGNSDLRETLAEALAGAGLLIEQAGDGAQALTRAAGGERIDVILLDLHLPDFKASELSQLLCAKPACAGARVIVLTGNMRARLIGFAGHAKLLHKPITLDELEAAVREACAA
jgi:CheY-like chemotaxis protein